MGFGIRLGIVLTLLGVVTAGGAVLLAQNLGQPPAIEIVLPTRTPTPALSLATATPKDTAGSFVTPAPSRASVATPTATKVNINTASAQELAARLPLIGDTKAQDIVAYRGQNGPFRRIEDIVLVKGIATVTFERLKDLITVE